MIYAYDKTYLEKAQVVLGRMLDYAVYDLKYKADDFFGIFIDTGYADRFGHGDFSLITGKSGVELARAVVETATGKREETAPSYPLNRSPEYWAGWAIAYYQWLTALSFREIIEVIPINQVINLYVPYHEMDIRQFCDEMSGLYKKRHSETNLKRYRMTNNITQMELSKQSGIPLRTIQQYEQRQKDINKASAEYLIALSKTLNCAPESLIEKV